MKIETIIIILTGLAAFISVVAAGLPFVNGDQLASRLRGVAQKRMELSLKQREAMQARARFQPRKHVGVMKSILERLKLENLLDARDLKSAMAQAGWRRQSAAITFIFFRMASPILMTVAALVFVSANPEYAKKTFAMKMLIFAGAAVLGYYLPNIVLSNSIKKRQAVLTRTFPDALDLLVICVDAGLSIEAAFNKVTEEMALSAPVIAEEMGLTAAELAFLGERRLAYDNLAERTGLPSVKSLATALAQSEKYGTSISNALKVISQEVRDTRMNAAEKKAAALPAQLTVPMIIFFLPVLFMVIIGPALIRVFHWE